MPTIAIDLGDRSYDIEIGGDLLSNASQFRPWICGRQVYIISNDVVAPLYLEQIRTALADFEVHEFILPDGESTKSLQQYGEVLDHMLSIPCDRATTVIALGGGVVGDLAGFVASSYQRGVPFIQVPTTLLSQVDSSVGGKTGVNHARGKNMIGAFYQPRRVVIDIDTLGTLGPRQLSAGLAEVIKYGLINDLELFCWLEEHIDAVRALEPWAVSHVVARSCANKARIVEQDEREGGVRALLNLGHTFGHAIETATGYRTWLHGEAVAVGMVMAAAMSRRLGWLNDTDCQRASRLIARAGLPVAPFSDVEPVMMRSLMQLDKKTSGGKLTLVLLKAIGEAVIVDQPAALPLEETLSEFALGQA